MAWVSDSTTSFNNLFWMYSASTPISGQGGFYRSSLGQDYLRRLKYVSTSKSFKTSKTYVYQTLVSNFSQDRAGTTYYGATLSVTTPWSYFTYSGVYLLHSNPAFIKAPINRDAHMLYFLSNPNSNVQSTTLVTYEANYGGFYDQTGSVPGYIHSFDLYETDWKFSGHAFATHWPTDDGTSPYMGWRYKSSNSSLKYVHPRQNSYTTIFSTVFWNSPTTTGGKYRRNPIDDKLSTNYSARQINYDKFNLSFEYSEPISSTYSFVSVYLLDALPNTTSYTTFQNNLNAGQLLGKFNTNGTYKFYDLQGENYLVFVASNVSVLTGNDSTYNTVSFSFDISNIEIDGSYSEPDNNIERLFTNSDLYSEPTPLSVLGTSNEADFSYTSITQQTQHLTDGPTGIVANGATGATGAFTAYFSNIYGTVSNLSILNSKVGNGKFKSGIWENGVWNSGIRIDENSWDFDDIVVAFNLSTQNIKWRFQLSGNEESVSNFEVGDKVSIGNVVGIDINEKRKLFKNYFTIIKKDETNIVVEIENNFPIRRIEKDSSNHKIKVTKNVWLNGAFLNGYWENGIWNDGMFKGYPIITEIYNSHWIDGKFDGGHFYGYTPQFNFVDTYYLDGYVGLTFGSATHGFVKGDLININKNNKGVNPQYDGNWVVTDIIDEHLIKTNINWGVSTPTGTEGGEITRRTNTSLIQNFEFIDNNVAKYNYLTVKGGQSDYNYQTGDIQKIWKFNSWVDLSYSSQSFTTLGRNKISFDPAVEDIVSLSSLNGNYGVGEYSEPNLRGGITNDILSSKSLFRDVDSQIRRYYSLGTKHDIYEDYIGESSNFDLPFNSKESLGGLSNFISEGWTYSMPKAYLGWNALITFLDNFYDGGKVAFASTEYANVQVGDRVYINQFIGVANTYSPFGPYPTYNDYNGNAVIIKIVATNSGFSPPSAAIPVFTDYYIYTIDKGFMGTTPPEGGIMRYGKRPEISVTISRTDDATLRIEQPNDSLQTLLLNNTNIKIPKRRYSTIEFDTKTFSNTAYPPIVDPVEKIFTPVTNVSIFPDQNIFNTLTSISYPFKNYYYNRPSLSLLLPSIGGFSPYSLTASLIPGYTYSSIIYYRFGNQSVEIDNLKFYEIDAVPFFKYTTEDYVNKSVQIPYVGVAPIIDYTNENFSFIESINIGLDSVQLNTNSFIGSTIQTATPSSNISFENS